MRLLLDTCALSEFQREMPNPGVLKLLEEVPEDNLFISVVSIGEILKGINLLSQGKRQQELQSWALGLERLYSQRILPIDLEVARIWGELSATAQQAGKCVPIADGLIAATARRHGLHILTRNTKDFAHTEAMIINPWLA